eukprot:TRINITY_DN6120_c0_g1_i1.p1 TRINITY_DN6120_c0_g1~~TRINITY_DN6120_c0_g1_i1.p1  ORF type:complete len:134 (-),score=17.86 TRINITY_DN6120_c0_g1_i1:161-562(-)
MSYAFLRRVDGAIPSTANDDLANCTPPSCYASLRGIMGGGRAGDAFTFWGGTWTGLNAYTMVIDLDPIILSSSPLIRANETKLISVEVDGSASCNFQLMDLSGLADRAVPKAGIDNLPPVPSPPALATYFCNI